MSARTKLFRSNRSQAVRIPKALRFPEGVTEVEVKKVGDALMIAPVDRTSDEAFDNGPRFTEDFMTDRDDPPVQERDF